MPKLRGCLHGGGGPEIGEVTCGWSPHLTCKRDQIKMRAYMDSGLPHLPGVLHLHVNRPLMNANRLLNQSKTYFQAFFYEEYTGRIQRDQTK